nr:hypothetical protein [Sphingopyxis sp. 113P3]
MDRKFVTFRYEHHASNELADFFKRFGPQRLVLECVRQRANLGMIQSSEIRLQYDVAHMGIDIINCELAFQGLLASQQLVHLLHEHRRIDTFHNGALEHAKLFGDFGMLSLVHRAEAVAQLAQPGCFYCIFFLEGVENFCLHEFVLKAGEYPPIEIVLSYRKAVGAKGLSLLGRPLAPESVLAAFREGRSAFAARHLSAEQIARALLFPERATRCFLDSRPRSGA